MPTINKVLVWLRLALGIKPVSVSDSYLSDLKDSAKYPK